MCQTVGGMFGRAIRAGYSGGLFGRAAYCGSRTRQAGRTIWRDVSL